MFKILPVDNIWSQIVTDNEEHFRALYSYFRIEDQGLKFTPAVRAGYSDGKKDLIKLNGRFHWGLGSKIMNWCQTRGHECENHVPSVAEPISDAEWNQFIQCCMLPFDPYDYQLSGARLLIEQKRHIGLAATSSGKSLIIYIILRWFAFKNIKAMLIVPDVGLVEQMFSDLKDYWERKELELLAELNQCYTDEMKATCNKWLDAIKLTRKMHNFENFEDVVCMIYAGKDKFTNHIIRISTWQSIFTLGSDGYFNDVDALVFDECHRTKSESYTSISNYCNAEYKIGMSGTMNPTLLDQLILEGTIGPATQIITPKQLIERGLATATKVQPILLQYDAATVKAVQAMKWPEESKFFRLHEAKIAFLVQFAKKMTSTGNGIVLAKNIDTQKAYLEELKKLHPNTMAIMQEVKPEQRESIRKSVDSYTDLALVCSAAIMTTGINIKSLRWAILAQFTKAEIATIQTLGRLLRLYDGKDDAIIFDIVDDCRHYSKSGRAYNNYGFTHFEERLNAYAKYQYPVEKPIIIKL